MGATLIIPARGGSKRILRKNIKDFNGRPMISWPIMAALESDVFDQVLVSTDDEEIARVALESGAEVPFERPKDLATSHVGTAPVIVHAIEELGLADSEVVMCMYPTSPLPPGMLNEAVELSSQRSETFVISVGRYRAPIERAARFQDNGYMEVENKKFLHFMTQDMPDWFFDAGKFHLASAGCWRKNETMLSNAFFPFLLPDWASVDMDEPDDWPIAEALHRAFVLEAQ